jgi:hypothetical protein
MNRCLYFGYCTFLDEPELRIYLPNAQFITKARVANHKIGFHAAGDRTDRGWCHLENGPSAQGFDTLGLVYEVSEDEAYTPYDDFEVCFMTVHGDDGNTYDCWSYRQTAPGVPMRPPNFYWQHIPTGLDAWEFPPEYIAEVMAIYEAAAECPNADRPAPTQPPSADPASR